MSNDDNNTTGGGRTLGGDAEPLPRSWSHPSERPRVGRIGDWSSTSDNRGGSSRFGSIANLGGGGHGAVDDDDEDEDENKDAESWFAGGERSGLSIENPDRQRVPGGDVVRELLRLAAQGGPLPEAQPRSTTAFTGGGHTLGSDEVESSYIPDASSEGVEEVIRHLTLWRNGFQVEDGELMRYEDPAHADVLQAITSGHAPPSIMNIAPGQNVNVKLSISKRHDEDYVPPKGTKAFTGSGHRLGAVVPDSSSGVASSSASMPGTFPVSGATPARSTASSSNLDNISTRFEVDQSLPTTSVQIRLADGTRMVCRMNLTHTVLDIRNFINASRPENLTRPYTIGTTFPNRILDDNTSTIEDAGLINSVVVQRWV